jgi:hypothetical protein
VIDEAPNHVIYKHLKKLNAIRRAVPALQKGTWKWGGNGGGNGVGIVREFGDSYAVVGLAKDGTVNFNFTGIRNGTYRDAVTGHEITVSNGSMTFRVAPSSAGIYVLNGPGRIGDLGAGYFQSDASGSQGSGGGGGTSTVYTVNPNPPQAGRSVTLTYTGSLKDNAAINLHWGRNGWQNVTTTAMAKVSGVWTLTMTVPAGTTMLDFVFNNGSGAWDNNNSQDYHVAVVAPTSIEERETVSGITLDQNAPNPFNPETVIRFHVGAIHELPVRMKISVYDILGRQIAVLADGMYPAGTHSVRFEASNLPSGLYLYRLEGGGTILARTMLFLK